MEYNKYYGCEDPESVTYLEFGSINLVKREKSIWNYWQDQDAYDLYMFARYSRDLFSFRRFFGESNKTVERLNEYVSNVAHNKLMDYIFKYAGLVAANEGGGICESGSSLYGWIDEAIACDFVYTGGAYVDKIKHFQYICSDISPMMNEGAKSFHSDIEMDYTTEDTLNGVIADIGSRMGKRLSLFYGVSVSIRYAIRDASDLVNLSDISDLCIFNRLSLTFDDDTLVATYGTGKSVYIVSLPMLVKLLKERGIYAKYCTANMQYEKDGKGTVRASMVISKDVDALNNFISIYDDCIQKSIHIKGIVAGEWKTLDGLLANR